MVNNNTHTHTIVWEEGGGGRREGEEGPQRKQMNVIKSAPLVDRVVCLLSSCVNTSLATDWCQ